LTSTPCSSHRSEPFAIKHMSFALEGRSRIMNG